MGRRSIKIITLPATYDDRSCYTNEPWNNILYRWYCSNLRTYNTSYRLHSFHEVVAVSSLNVPAFTHGYTSLRLRNTIIAGFVPIVLFALGADSQWLLARGFDGQQLSNLAAPLYFLFVLAGLRPNQRLMALVFVPFSALGEYLFSLVFQLYAYKFDSIPLYVPFGHAILFGTGLLIAEHPVVLAYESRVRNALLCFHVGLFAGAIIILYDTLSAIFGVLFLLILYRKRCQPFYLIMGVLVLYIELVGTVLGCWTWNTAPFGVLTTTNPPVGAFVCYVIADILVIKITRCIDMLRLVVPRQQGS